MDMDVVLDDAVTPSPPPPSLPVAATSSAAATTAIPQLGLPMHPPHHFSHCSVYDVGLRRNPPLLPPATEEYYARNRHGLTPYDGPDGAPAPVSARRIDKSGLLEVSETDPATYPRSCALTKDVVGTRSSSLRVDRMGLLEAVPEDVDAPEEHCGDGSATTKTLDEAATVPLGETLKVEADVHSRSPFKFDDSHLLEPPSSLEGRSDEVDTWNRTADIKVLTGSPRAHLDVSIAVEKLWKRRTELTHLPSSPASTLRRLRNDPSRASPLINRGADADAARLRNQKSPEFAAKSTTANSASRKFTDSSQSPIMRDRLQLGYSKDNFDPTSINSDDPAVDAKTLRGESLLAIGNEQKNESSSGEKRVEAEGCEHTVVESVKEKKVSFKGSNKLPDDNVQTPRVIILSERL